MSERLDDSNMRTFDQPRKRIGRMNAEEAYQRAKNASDIIAEKELTPIYDRIEKTASDGEFTLKLSKKTDGLSKHSIRKLKELNYRVNEWGDEIVVSWDKKVENDNITYVLNSSNIDPIPV